jgi:hypothetical protein
MEAITLKSGHVFEPMSGPDWASSKKLFKILARELKSVDIDLTGLTEASIKDMDSGVLVTAFLQVAGSDAVESAVLECAARCTLQGQKITAATFEPQDMRRDYLPVAWEVMKLALLPFFEDLLSALSTPGKESSPSLP